MKKYLFTTLLILLTSILFAQNYKNSFRTEVSPAFSNNKLFGYSLSNEFTRTIVKNIDLGLSVEFQNFTDQDFQNISLNYKNIGLNCYYNFNILPFAQLQLGIGGFYQNTDEISFSQSTTMTNIFGELFPVYNTNTIQYNGFGYTATLGLIIPVNNLIAFSFRTVIQNDTNGNFTSSLRPGIKIKF